MSTDSTSIAPEASSTEPTVEQRKKAALRAWDLTGLLLLLVLAGLFFGGSGLVLYLHSIDRPTPPNPAPIVDLDDGDDAHLTIDAAAIKALVELDRLSFSMELAQADQAFARLEVAESRWKQRYRQTLNDDVGRRIAGSNALVTRFIALDGMKGPQPLPFGLRDKLKELAEAAESSNDDRTLQNLIQVASGIKDGVIAWYAHHQARVQMLESMRRDAAGLAMVQVALATLLESHDERLAAERQLLADAETRKVKTRLGEQRAEIDGLIVKQHGLVAMLKKQLALVESGEAIQQTEGAKELSPPASRAEFRREHARIQTLLKPFITPGYMQPKSADELVYGQSKIPMSYSALLRVGALKESEQRIGIGILLRVGGGKSANLNNDRPLGEFPRMNSQADLQKPAVVARLKEAQRLLRIYGPLMVEDGLLSP